jgi:hypothetical protein
MTVENNHGGKTYSPPIPIRLRSLCLSPGFLCVLRARGVPHTANVFAK